MKQDPTARTFLSGRYFTPQEISEIQETVRIFWRLSFSELVRTLCEHLQWLTPAGRYKVDSCAKALQRLEAQGLLKLPDRRGFPRGREKTIVTPRTDSEEELVGTVRDFEPIEVEPVMQVDLLRLRLRATASMRVSTFRRVTVCVWSVWRDMPAALR